MSPDSVVLEVAILHFPESAEFGQFWDRLDEQGFDSDARRRLADNGFRAGIIRGDLPSEFQAQIDSQRSAQREIDPENSPGGIGEQRLQCRAGKRNKILISDPNPTLSVLIPTGERLTGKSLTNAQCLFSVKSFPRGDGGADLEITPEIEHGDSRQRWVGQAHEGTFRLDSNRERLTFDNLRVRPSLIPGEVVVLSCTPEPKGLGRQFCCDLPQGAGAERRVLLIRLAQTQIDDLFMDQAGNPPLATPLE